MGDIEPSCTMFCASTVEAANKSCGHKVVSASSGIVLEVQLIWSLQFGLASPISVSEMVKKAGG